eukprot:11219246-Lingulodinium_polyedra.AAC.1
MHAAGDGIRKPYCKLCLCYATPNHIQAPPRVARLALTPQAKPRTKEVAPVPRATPERPEAA